MQLTVCSGHGTEYIDLLDVLEYVQVAKTCLNAYAPYFRTASVNKTKAPARAIMRARRALGRTQPRGISPAAYGTLVMSMS